MAAGADFNDRINDKRTIEGAVQFAFIDVPIATDNVATNAIDLIELPLGAIVYPELSRFHVLSDPTDGVLTGDIGDSGDVDRYSDGANLAAVGAVEFLAPAIPDGFTNRHQVTAATRLVKLTLATFTGVKANATVRVVLAYKSL